jgi:potassium/chloride transporter 4/5/6
MEQPTHSRPRFGAFLGVFTPTILTILGVIMFLRLGWVVGVAGLWGTVFIVVFANAITMLTAFSLSSLASNMRVGVGGAYFIISRSLGLEAGGAIGIPLYISQVLSLTLYAFGLAESVRIVWADAPVGVLAAIIVVVVSAIASRSSELVLKVQVPIMVLIGVALTMLFVGVEFSGSKVPAIGSFEEYGFWTVFAVFFPAVTGILAGVSMSGDLKEPGKAIPRGVISAVMVGFVVYVSLPFVLANAVGQQELIDNPLIWTEIAPAWLVMPGLWGAILSSAFGSILSAPRTLQALAIDGLAPKRFAEVSDDSGEPLPALYLSAIIAFIAVGLGGLNLVAIVLTMFFLTTYGTLNLVAGVEALVSNPSFRPSIEIPWWASFAGALGCLVAMFAINPIACVVAVIIEFAIFFYLKRQAMVATWGDVRSGVWYWLARKALLGLRGAPVHSRNWRPHFLVFTADLPRNIDTVRLAAALNQGRGIITISTLLVGDVEEHNVVQINHDNERLLEKEALTAFCETTSVSDLQSGVVTVAQSNGFAGLSSNTMLFGWPGSESERLGAESERLSGLLRTVRKLDLLGKSSMIYRQNKARDSSKKGQIVIWWKGKEHNGDLMLLLAHLLCRARGWRRTKIALQCVVPDTNTAVSVSEEFEEMLKESRIDAVVNVIVNSSGEAVPQIIRRHSQGARLVFMGLPVAQEESVLSYAQDIHALVSDLPDTVLVRNSGPFRGRLI